MKIGDREFIKLTVRNSNGRPYYSIIYLEVDDNGVGHDFEGYSSYSLDVISDYLKKYFMPYAQPEPCEDAVSRETVKEQMLKYGFRAPDMTVTEFVEDCLPSVTPKQRTGKWIKLDMHRGMADHKCTACEQECYVPTCMGEPMYAFCPNCGAKMDGRRTE